MSVADAVHHKLRKPHNNRLLRSRLNPLNRSVTQPLHNANFAVSNSSNDSSKTNNGESTVVRRKLNVRQDLCDSNNRKVNASQHQHDRNSNSSDV